MNRQATHPDDGRAPGDPALDRASAVAEAADGGADTRPMLPAWCGWLLLILGSLTLPWIAGMAELLPSRAEAAHYDISWVGFDILLCLLLLRTGWSVLHDQDSVGLSAAMAGTLLIVDAWFDVMSAATTVQFTIALAMAVIAELPLALFCLWIAGHVEFERRRRLRRVIGLLRRLDGRRSDHRLRMRRNS